MSKEVEEWRPIQGYEGLYEVSDLGRIKGLERTVIVYSKLTNTTFKRFFESCIKSKHHDKDGYEMVNLKKDGKHSTKKVHKLVATAFIPNLDNKSCIDHINGIRDDNRVENLRWCTQKENLNYPLARANNSKSKKISCLKRNRDKFGRFKS